MPKKPVIERKSEVGVTLDGRLFKGWNSVSVNWSIDSLASSFRLGLMDIWEEKDPPQIHPGMACTIKIDDILVLTGYVDKASLKLDDASRAIQIEGRSRIADIVDCSAVNKPASWSNVKPEAVIVELVDPYSIRVLFDGPMGAKLPSFALNSGETPFEAVQRICKNRGFIYMSDPDGDLVIASAGTDMSTDKLVLGKNILSAESEFDHTNRFRTYRVKGQRSVDGDSWTSNTVAVIGEATDEGIERNRVKVFASDDVMDKALAQKRAAWEAQTRMGRSGKVTVRVPTWFQSNGEIWKPNVLVACDIPPLRLTPATPLLINEVDFSQDDSGSVTAMTLVWKDAYKAEPAKVTKAVSTYGW